jgi:hypothetical protein
MIREPAGPGCRPVRASASRSRGAAAAPSLPPAATGTVQKFRLAEIARATVPA